MSNLPIRCMFIVAAALSWPAFAWSETKTLTLDSAGLQSLRITAGAGFLHVVGTEANKPIEVLAEVNGDEDDYRLTLEKVGNQAVLVSEVESWSFLWTGSWFGIDLTVKVPSGLALEINDGAGDITLRDVNSATTLYDGSGSITIRSHRGSLDIKDGSGGIDIAGVNGQIKINDGSGGIVVQNIIGNVNIHDGSGSMTIKNVDGHVTISDGSGAINVDTVKHGLTVKDSGSGGLTVKNIDNGESTDNIAVER